MLLIFLVRLHSAVEILRSNFDAVHVRTKYWSVVMTKLFPAAKTAAPVGSKTRNRPKTRNSQGKTPFQNYP